MDDSPDLAAVEWEAAYRELLEAEGRALAYVEERACDGDPLAMAHSVAIDAARLAFFGIPSESAKIEDPPVVAGRE